MATLSNWRAYFKRFYETAPGYWSSEIKEVSQLYSKSIVFPNSYYQIYTKDNIALGEYIQPTQWYSYRPGDSYKAKYYTIYDMFSKDELESIQEEASSLFMTHLDTGYITFYFPTKLFWKTPDSNGESVNGMNFVPIIGVAIDKARNPSSGRSSGSIAFGWLCTKHNPHYIKWNTNAFVYNNVTVLERNVDYDTDFNIYTGSPNYSVNSWIYAYSPSNTYAADFQKSINIFFNHLRNIRFYPTTRDIYLYRRTVDGIYYGEQQSSYIPSVGSETMGWIYDFSHSPYYNTVGFIANIGPWEYGEIDPSGSARSSIVKVDTSGGPEPKDPDEEDDPNDDDDPPNPDDDGGDGDHDNTTDPVPPPGPPIISASGVGLLTIFNPTSSQLASLGKQFWDPTVLQALKQFFTEPTDAIIGLGIIPVQPRLGDSSEIHLGIYNTEVSATKVASDYVIKDCGSIPITRYYGSYLDYDPYTKISLYLPYIGEIDIDPDQVMQTNLGVEYHINVVTGDAVAIVTSNGSVIYTASGNCMRQIPIAQKDFSAIINTAVAAVSTIATAGVSAGAAKAVGGAVAGASKSEAGKAVADARTNAQLKNMEMGAGSSLIDQVMSSKFKYKHAGDIGGGAGQLAVQSPYLTIERPNLMLADKYKSFVGYPCNKTLKLSACHGFTQIEATRLSIAGATDEEITEALSYLVEGVII